MRDLNEVRRGGEPDVVKMLRQLCILLIASDYDIKAFCDCNGSRFRFNFNTATLGQKLKECFDQCLNFLTPIEDEDVVRVIERQGLQAWRDVIGKVSTSLLRKEGRWYNRPIKVVIGHSLLN